MATIFSLPCAKGGGTACRDGGIVKSDNLHKTIPQSASPTRLAPSRSLPAGDALTCSTKNVKRSSKRSLWLLWFTTREPLTQRHSSLNFFLLSTHQQSLYRTPPLWQGFRYTINRALIHWRRSKNIFSKTSLQIISNVLYYFPHDVNSVMGYRRTRGIHRPTAEFAHSKKER